MKLYSSPLSPYSARVRASLYHKNIEVETIKPSSIGGMGSPGFLAVTPIGKIPVLKLTDGTTVVESDTIVEYLEDLIPTPSLRPSNLESRARARMLSRIVELYVMGAVSGLTPMMPISIHRAPVARDEKTVDHNMALLTKALNNVEHFLAKGVRYAVDAELTTADTALASFLPFVRAVERFYDQEGLIEERPTLAALVARLPETLVLQRVFDEVSTAIQERRSEVQAKFG